MKVAAIFPGQGAQFVGMGKDLVEFDPIYRETFEEASNTLGFDLLKLCLEGPEEELTLTYHAQPAILTMSIGIWRIIQNKVSWKPDFVAGHSLGEYSALVAAGALPLSDAVRLVYYRGRFMQEAVPVGEGAMCAVIGLDDETVINVCNEINRPDFVVQPANFNAPGQVVIAGHKEAVDKAGEKLKTLKARIIPLKVSAPFHTVLMKPAEDRLAELIDIASWADPQIPWFNNVTATPISDANTARDTIKRQITAPVQWTRVVQGLIEHGVRQFREIGPGKVLCGLNRRITKEIPCHSINNLASLKEFLDSIS